MSLPQPDRTFIGHLEFIAIYNYKSVTKVE